MIKNIKFKGNNKEFKIFLDEAMQELELDKQEKRSCTSANVQAPALNNTYNYNNTKGNIQAKEGDCLQNL